MEIQQIHQDCDDSLKFSSLVEKLLALTQSRICDRKMLTTYFKNINELDPRLFNVNDKNAMMLLVNQLCSIIQPSEISLIIGCSRFLANLIQRISLQGRTFTVCMRWITENLEFSEPAAAPDLLCALQSLLLSGPSDSLAQDLRKLLGEKSVLSKHIYPDNQRWNEEQFLALNCLKAILSHAEKNDYPVQPEFLMYIKSTTFQILSKLPQDGVIDKIYYNKMVSLCLRILRSLLDEKFRSDKDENVGEILGVIQVHLFHGIEGYPSIAPLILHPSSLNLPDLTHSTQKKKYFRNHKVKNKRQPSKKTVSNNTSLDAKGIHKHSSDSDASDGETKNMKQLESRVRLEAVHLLSALVECIPSREIFGFWTQIVASGSQSDARVLTRCILKEPNAKVRQMALTTLNDLLIGAKVFLSHAEDVEKMSFVTFFGMLSSVIKEIHSTLSLLLGTERNVVVLTQALKCAAALAQGTPYSRLKPGLATKLIRNCRNHLLHKDPTVRVAALAVFETIALSDPLTPEIYNILAKSSNSDVDIEIPKIDLNSCDETEVEEIVCDDPEENNDNQIDLTHSPNVQEACVSALVKICFKNVTKEISNEPVRIQSLKLLGTLAFNASNLIFSHIEAITNSLISIANHEPCEPQVSFHACRVLEIIAGRLSDSGSENTSKFWNIAFNPIIALVQHSQTNMREIACDCLGNIGAEMFAQLSRDKSIMVITVLFGATQDEESAVRAASLRALGLLVSLPTLEEDTGFLLDLTDITCTASEDRNLGVRVKAAWALASLCDCLVKREDNVEVESIPLETILPKLYRTSTKAAQDNEKVRCNAVRAIGNILYLCPDQSILQDTSMGLEALINCATTGNDMKVRWNACRAIGTILSRDPDAKLIPTWKEKVFPVLCDLICSSPNFKVRTNAAWALSVCNSFDKHTITLWKSIFLALENSQHVPSYIEYAHRDALVQQLCLTLCHLASYTEIAELESLWAEIKDHFEEISHHMKQFQDHVLPEKAGDLTKAQACFISFTQNAPKLSEKECAKKLLELFKKEDKFSNIDAFSIVN
ncbi:hypothetical protein QAD02_022936 [Eretmocerus hayati]|uniref:Uncharacterized protein n=1 Tax=Eretmocerus hayati TaxID=131215 RepID=A0ACC2PUL1_9HYME|nr:hypothetical protein QAD02_022936 [Eretmocerus hayati]